MTEAELTAIRKAHEYLSSRYFPHVSPEGITKGEAIKLLDGLIFPGKESSERQKGEVMLRDCREIFIDRMQRDREFCRALLDEHVQELSGILSQVEALKEAARAVVRSHEPRPDPDATGKPGDMLRHWADERDEQKAAIDELKSALEELGISK